MQLSDVLERAVRQLREEDCLFALCGGIAAGLYRTEQRFTRDVDIILSAPDGVRLATSIIEGFKLKAHALRLAELSPSLAMHKKQSPVALVVGRHPERKETEVGLDFILPSLPWVPRALERAQFNLHDFGFGTLPCITVEDMIIAKAAAGDRAERGGRDIDDLASIFKRGVELDLAYIAAEFDRLGISVSKEIEMLMPKALAVAARRIRTRSARRKTS